MWGEAVTLQTSSISFTIAATRCAAPESWPSRDRSTPAPSPASAAATKSPRSPHNDFTTSSYLACAVARQAGIKSFTLQHGFPTQEYFPTSADHYVVWGPRFREYMQ